VLDALISQGDPIPFNPRLAVARFALLCRKFRCRDVHGDAYAGQTFRFDFSECGIDYVVEKQTRTDLYENLEVALNAGQAELLDLPKLHRELLMIVRKGASLDHMPGRHDDWATSAAGALTLVNPDIGRTEPGILEFYRRQSEATIGAMRTPPTLQQEHAGAAVLQQIGTKRPVDFVKVLLPADSETSNVMGISGSSYLVEIENDRRVVWLSEPDALAMVNSPFALGLFEANADLRTKLQEKQRQRGNRPSPWQGMRWSDVQQAAEDARPRHWNDKGGHAHDALRAMGRWPQ